MPPKKELIGSDSERKMLVPDLVRLVLDRLDFVAFHKARSFSLDWYSTAELCFRQNPTPWIILFPTKNNGSCKLYDPCQNKSYTMTDLGLDFSMSRCLANSGSWFLMLDPRTNLYLFNLFTRERIHLPSLETIQVSDMRFERVGESDFVMTYSSISKSNKVRIRKAVLWVDERRKDYFVVWNFDSSFAYHHKKGDTNESWKVVKPLNNDGCDDMVFKDGKLYRLSGRTITVFDFYGGVSPMLCSSFELPEWYRPKFDNRYINLAVTLSGEVLIVSSRGSSFYVYKMDPKSSEWSRIESFGDEALLLDQGITVAPKDGVMKNCVYLCKPELYKHSWMKFPGNGIRIYNIQTKKKVKEFEHLSDSSSSPFKDARWFFPTFGGKWLV